jgi:DNA-binding SARP family transcriptional activator
MEPRVSVLVEVRLLGQPRVLVEGRPVAAFASPRLLSLLAFLVFHRQAPVRRQRVAFLFWPDSTESQAHTNLRQALHNLRRALPEPDLFLRVDGTEVQWRADAPARIDVVEFEDAAGTADRVGDRAILERAASLYTGDLLPGWYEDWIEPERNRLRQTEVRMLESLSDLCERQRDAAAGIRYTQQLIELDPLHEASYRRLMRLHVQFGERPRALRTYHACVSVLERELGVAPAAATSELYEALVAGDAATAPPCPSSDVVLGPRLVGREHEWRLLLTSLRSTESGRGRFVLVTGEAGIGKSRLVDDFRTWCVRQGVPTAAARAYPAEGHLPYAPIAELLRSPAIRPALGRLDEVWLSEIARVLAELLIEHPELPQPVTHAVSERSRLFEALTRAITGTGRPLVLVVDDLQWCDAETLEFLHYLVRSASDVPLLVIGTVRDDVVRVDYLLPSLIAGLRAIDAIVDVPLVRLDITDASALVAELLGDGVDDVTVRQLVGEAEGNPLFLVELARSRLVAAGSISTSRPSVLPPKVQSVIEVRLGQLSASARQLIGVAAVVGREFHTDLLARLLPKLGDGVVAGVDELWRRGIVREQGHDAYDFSHDKIREVAYSAIGPARRRRLHGDVARALESLHADSIGAVAAQIAAHFDQAGSVNSAVEYYQRAIVSAQRLFAHDEVIRMARRALELLKAVPAGSEQDQQELSLLIPLGVALYAGPGDFLSQRDVFERANVLRAERGLPAEPSTIRLSANSAIVARDFNESDRLGGLLLAGGRDTQDPVLVAEGHYLQGVSHFWRGAFANSRHHLRRALVAYEPERAHEHLERFGQDAKAVCLVRLGWTEWHLGRCAEAANLREQALARAGTLGHPYTLGYVRALAAWSALDADSAALVVDLARDLPGSDQNLWLALMRDIFAAWVEARTGDLDTAVARLEEASATARTRRPLVEPLALLSLAAAHHNAGDPDRGLTAATAARQIAEREMQFHCAEARRLEGLLLARRGDSPDDVETAFRDAVDTAVAQGATVLELRARTTFIKWLSADGRRAAATDEARRLETLLGRLPPDIDLADVCEARGVLADRH